MNKYLPLNLKDSFDTDGVDEIIALGWPANEPYLYAMAGWCMDGNFAVAHRIAPYLVSLGSKATPYVKLQIQDWIKEKVFDEVCDLLNLVVLNLSNEDVRFFSDELHALNESDEELCVNSGAPFLAAILLWAIEYNLDKKKFSSS